MFQLQQLILFCSVIILVQAQSTIYQTSILKWVFWDPAYEQWNWNAVLKKNDWQYVRELRQNQARMFMGLYSVATVKAPTRLRNGHIFEGAEVNAAPPQATLDLGNTFGLHMWIYIIDITGTHTLFCKQQPTIADPGIQLCLNFDSSKFWWTVRDCSVGGIVSAGLGDADMLEDVPLTDMVPQVGWQYLAFNIYVEIDITSFSGYYMTDSYQTYNTTTPYKSVYGFIDDPVNNWLTLGAMQATTTTITNQFIGIIHEVEIFSSPLGFFQINDQATWKCQPYCGLCKVADIPKCIQQYERTLLAYYDFAPPKFKYQRNINDLSPYGRNFGALTIDTQWTEPTRTGTDPVYVDRQGFLFDRAGARLQLGGFNQQVNSFSVEVWVRFEAPPFPNNAYIVRKSNGAAYFALYVSNIPEICLMVNGITMKVPVTITANSWYFIVGTVYKINTFQSTYCILFYNTYQCGTYNQIFTDTGAMTFTIGGGFRGVINKVKVFQYPKIQVEARHNMRLYSENHCLDFNGNPCQQCDIEDKGPDTNFKYKCKSTCAYNEYETDCRTCHSLCRTCFGSDEYHCHSCSDVDYDFLYLGTRCVQQCGLGKNLGYYECDDGNLNNGDGCTSYCKVEKGYTCTHVGTGVSTCVEICGDGRKVALTCGVGCFRCDDANTVSGDGCSSTCIVEPGYQCDGGGLTNRDVCYEKCGDGLNLGSYQCDDGNTADGDGCSSGCQIELGFTCSGGTPTTPDTCTEICGDGMDRGIFQCDDGGKQNGDGCDQNCLIEWGWKCYSETNIVPSKCSKISSPIIVNYWIDDKNKALKIRFNETILITSDWKPEDWNLTISGPIPPYNMTWSLFQQGSLMTIAQQEIYINLTINSQIYGMEVLIFDIVNKQTTISGFYLTATETEGFSIPLYAQDDALAGDCGLDIYRIPIFAMLYSNLILALASAAMLQTTTVLFHLIGCIQILSLCLLYEAVFPTCLINFFRTLSLLSINFKLLGGEWISGFVSSSSFPFTVDDKFIRAGMTQPSVLFNSGDLLFLWILLFVTYCIAYAIEFVLHSVPYMRTVCQRYRYNFYNAAMNFTFIKMAFDSTFALFYIRFDNGDQIFSSSVAIGLAAFTLFYPAYVSYQSGMYAKELSKVDNADKLDNIRAKHLFVEYDPTHPTCYTYLLAHTVKKMLFVAIAILMYKVQCYSLLLSGMVQLASMLYFSYVRPFKQPLYNVMIIFEEVMTLFCFIVLFKFANITNVVDILESKSQAKLFAMLVMLLTIIPAVFALFELIRSLKYFNQVCNWKKDLKEEKEKFDSSDEDDQSVDLLNNERTEDSLVEKEISISDDSDEGPTPTKKPTLNRDSSQRQDESQYSPDISRDQPKQQDQSNANESNIHDDDQNTTNNQTKQPTKANDSKFTDTTLQNTFGKQDASQQQQQKPQQTIKSPQTNQQQQQSKSYNFQALDFSNVPEEAKNAKERLPGLQK